MGRGNRNSPLHINIHVFNYITTKQLTHSKPGAPRAPWGPGTVVRLGFQSRFHVYSKAIKKTRFFMGKLKDDDGFSGRFSLLDSRV